MWSHRLAHALTVCMCVIPSWGYSLLRRSGGSTGAGARSSTGVCTSPRCRWRGGGRGGGRCGGRSSSRRRVVVVFRAVVLLLLVASVVAQASLLEHLPCGGQVRVTRYGRVAAVGVLRAAGAR